MLRICAVDDEQDSITTLRSYLEKYFGSDDKFSLTAFHDGKELIENYSPEFDLVFLDIEMPNMNGYKAAKHIRSIDDSAVIVFLTRMKQYAVKGYEVNAIDFLVKPVEYGSFEIKFRKILRAVKKRDVPRIEIRRDGNVMYIPCCDIIRVEVIGHELIYHTEEGEYRNYGSLRETENRLSKYGFISVSRYTLVNLRHVIGVYDWYIMVGNEKIEISRRKRKEVVAALTGYYGDRV